MDCPKCKTPNLNQVKLNQKLSAYHCNGCEGNWLNGDAYKIWQSSQLSEHINNHNFPWIDQQIDNFTPSEFDNKAAFCPECSQYLARGKISINPPFYVERCPQCKGMWCDGKEWEILNKLNLHYQLDNLFSTEWQSLIREKQHQYQEKQALINKIGVDLATKIFALGEILEKHPNGDFAVAYLMRKVGESEQIKR
jgi:Zn-finger nucleic acid-binding protein